MRKPIFIATLAVLLFALACVTVNVYFPAAEIQDAADRIEEEVRGEEPSQAGSEAAPIESRLRRMMRAMAFESEAYAQIDINITTPTIRALIASRTERFGVLKPLYELGAIGETNDGMLSVRSIDAMALKDKASVKKLVKAENADRANLYAEIAKANNLAPDILPQIKQKFANSMRKKAKPGWWVQKDDGDWVKKPTE
jgi:uncharacterized protein YdbL (DUF1318 family)